MKKILGLLIMLGILTAAGVEAFATKAGEAAPTFVLEDLSGKKVDLSSLAGRVVFVDFWAHWCGPCKKELPVLDKLATRYGGKDVVFLAINVDTDKADAVAFLKASGVAKLNVLLDPKSSVVEKYHPSTMPSSFVVDQKGKIRFVNVGYNPGDEKKFAQQIDGLL